MSKILVEVFVPASQRRCDVLIPYQVRLAEVTELVKAVVADPADVGFAPDADSVLCSRDSGAIYNINLTPRELGMENGSKLMLV